MDQSFADYGVRLSEYIRLSLETSRRDGHLAQADDSFNQLARALFTLQYHSVPAYRRFCDARRVAPASLGVWSQIPTVPTCAFKELELTSLPPDRRTHVFLSSGTTNQPRSRNFHCAESLAIYERSLLGWFREHLLRESPLELGLIALTPPPAEARQSSLVHMFETIRRSFPWRFAEFTAGVDDGGTWILDTAASLQALTQALDAGLPVLLLGTAFSFLDLLDHLKAQNFRVELPPGSRVLETGGYKGRTRIIPKHELQALIARWLGVPESHIVCEYGMSELSSQAYDRNVGNAERETRNASVFLFPPWARARIISPETGEPVADGETGLIQVFDLANVRSVMAVQTEDLAVRRSEGFELLGRAQSAELRGCSLAAA